MIKRDITETIYEYDKEGKLIKKTVTETHETEEGTTLTYPYSINTSAPNTNDWWRLPYVTNAGQITPTATLNNPVTYSNKTTTD